MIQQFASEGNMVHQYSTWLHFKVLVSIFEAQMVSGTAFLCVWPWGTAAVSPHGWGSQWVKDARLSLWLTSAFGMPLHKILDWRWTLLPLQTNIRHTASKPSCCHIRRKNKKRNQCMQMNLHTLSSTPAVFEREEQNMFLWTKFVVCFKVFEHQYHKRCETDSWL